MASNDSSIYNFMSDRSFEDMSAVGKNLGIAAVIQAGGYDPRLINLPNINKAEGKGLLSPKQYTTQMSSA